MINLGNSKNNSQTFSYYFDNFVTKLYDFDDKELCVRNYVLYMFDRTQRMFEYKGLPDTIPQRMLEFLLQFNGFACFAKAKGELYAFYGGLGGEPDPYYRPTICVVSNPALKLSKTYEIDKDCVIVRNDSLLQGLVPLFSRYATAMVENDISFRMASINTRIEFLLSAPDDGTKKAAEKFLEDVAAGKLGVIASNEFLDGIKAQEVGRTMRTFTDLIEYQQYLKASWFNEIGLNANYNMKREKLSTTESQMNNDALLPLVDDMLKQRKECIEQVNAMFGTNITVDFASTWEQLLAEFEAETEMALNGESNQLDSEGVSDNARGGMVDGEHEIFRDEHEVRNQTDGETVREDGVSETSSNDVRDSESSESDETDASEIEAGVDSESDAAEGASDEGQAELETSDAGVEVNVVVDVNVGEDSNQLDSDDSEVSEDEHDDTSGSV